MSQTVRLIPTASQTVGPFFHFAIGLETLGRLVGGDAKGERLRLRVRVFDGDGAPVPDALIEIHQADADGRYVTDRAAAATFTGFGRLPTSAAGVCEFETIRPGRVAGAALQASHVNVCIFARGLLHHLFTRVYFDGDPDLASDSLLAAVPPERRHTLMARPVPGEPGTWAFDVRLQAGEETVFFDL